MAWREIEILSPFVGSMAQLASGGGWETTLTLVNTSATSGEAPLSFLNNDGNPLQLPFVFSQVPSPTGPQVVSTLDQPLNAYSMLVLDSQQPGNANAQVGSAQLLTNGDIGGFAVFKYAPTGQEAVVPLETRNAQNYLLAFDNTGGVVTGVAIANVAPQPANISTIIRDDTGAQIGTDTIKLTGQGHASFMLTGIYGITAGHRGTVEFDTPAEGQISVLGLRVNGKAITTLPVLAQVDITGGALAHVATGGGWETLFTLVNAGADSASLTLSFYEERTGAPQPLTFVLPQSGTAAQTAASVTQSLAPGATLLIQTQGGSATITCSAQLTTTGNVSGFAIFQIQASGQEAVVPLETRTPTAFVLAYDNTNGLATGVALANLSATAGSVNVVVRDDTGATLTTGQVQLAGNGHASFMLTDATLGFPVTASKRGTVEFDTPTAGKISALGIRAVTKVITTIPVLAR